MQKSDHKFRDFPWQLCMFSMMTGRFSVGVLNDLRECALLESILKTRNIPRHIFILVVSGYFIFVYSSYLTVDLSALWIWINHPHAIKTDFANVSVVVELFI